MVARLIKAFCLFLGVLALAIVALSMSLGDEAEPVAPAVDQRAALRAIAVQRAATMIDTEEPEIRAQLQQIAADIDSDLMTSAEASLDAVKERVALLLEGPHAARPGVQQLQKDLNVQLAAVGQWKSRAEMAQREFDKANAADDIEVVTSTWEKSGFGSIGVWRVTLHNRSSVVAYHDLVYQTRYAAPSGTEVTVKTGQILDTLAPGQRRTFRDINDGFINAQASRASFSIVGGAKTRPN